MLNRQGTLYDDKKSHKLQPTIDGPPVLEEEKKPREIPSYKEVREIDAQSQNFDTLVKKSGRVLLRARAVFPFDFFPDTIVIDESKINIIHGVFFYAHQVQSIIVQHVKDVLVDRSLLFSTLRILPDGFSEEWVTVRYLSNKDAVRARRIILGLLVGYKEGIDITKVETENLEKKIEALGAVN